MANLFLPEELSESVSVTPAIILEWEKQKLIKAAGYTEENIPYFTNDIVNEAKAIKSLTDLGYEPAEILKIKKKVGLPGTGDNNSGNISRNKLLTVGELAQKIGISTRTLKHWEDKGIIESDMRSEGGFRLYSENYVYLCSLIQDLQNFGYSLDEIKVISDHFRDFLAIESDMLSFDRDKIDEKTDNMLAEIDKLFTTMNQLKKGINRWEELLKSKKKEIAGIRNKNSKRDS